MPPLDLETSNGLSTFRPRGRHTLVQAVDLVSRAIADCRQRGIGMLLIDVTGLEDVPIPTLVDRFLMVEDWAHASKGVVVVSMVASPEYIHPRKFGVHVALHFGLVCNVHSSEAEAREWLIEARKPHDPA